MSTPPQVPGNGIFTSAWSPIITGGLGTSACCGLITAGIGSWQCFVGITPPDAGGGGGSFAVHPGIYVPWPKGVTKLKGKRVVVVTVKMKDKKWTKNYMVDDKHSKFVVEAIRFFNATTTKLSVGVSSVQRMARKVTAMFRN